MDFDFHHLVAISSGNHIYPLLLNSFKHCYINLAGQFYMDSTVVPVVFGFHKTIVKAFEVKDDEAAAIIMRQMLIHGAKKLKAKKVKAQGSKLEAQSLRLKAEKLKARCSKLKGDGRKSES